MSTYHIRKDASQTFCGAPATDLDIMRDLRATVILPKDSEPCSACIQRRLDTLSQRPSRILNKDVCASDGLQPVEEFLDAVLGRLSALGYEPHSAQHALVCTIEASERIYNGAFVFLYDNVRASVDAEGQIPDDIYRALMADAQTWIDGKEPKKHVDIT